MSADGKVCTFEYDNQWLASGFSISPLELPLKPGLFIAKATPFNGNFGVFEDSLPDGYGRYLLHKALLKEGINDFELSALDRLSIVGNGGMGALTYEPITSIQTGHEIEDFDLLQAKALEVLKEQQDNDAGLLLYNSGNSGGCRPKAIFTNEDGNWLVKFRHTYDPQDMGKQEYHYNEIAKQCGIQVPDFKLVNNKYFACRRFDISPTGERIHVATAGALLNVSLFQPHSRLSQPFGAYRLSYSEPRGCGRNVRRMVFNYIMDNKDDSYKNYSFLVQKESDGKWHWHLAPAYDLTHCTEGYNGEHATSVNGTGHPTVEDMIAVGVKNKMKEKRCREIYEEISLQVKSGENIS